MYHSANGLRLAERDGFLVCCTRQEDIRARTAQFETQPLDCRDETKVGQKGAGDTAEEFERSVNAALAGRRDADSMRHASKRLTRSAIEWMGDMSGIRKGQRQAFGAPQADVSQRNASRALPSALAALVTSLWILGPTNAYSGQISVAWDYSTPAAAGFELYCGPASGIYTLRFDVGNALSYSVSGLIDGARYYCAVTAYDSSKVQSAPSAEISVAVSPAPGASVGQIAPVPIKGTLPPLPAVNFSAKPASGEVPLSVHFENRTPGKIDSWSWNFGDGSTSTERSPRHVYIREGNYTVTLSANNIAGTSTKSNATPIVVTLPPLPAINFSAKPASGEVPLTVRFENRTPRTIDSWAWDFGDGSTSTEKSPTHVYTRGGNYTVTLSATNFAGTSTKSNATPIVVTLPPLPAINFSAKPASGQVPLTVRFENHTTGKVDSWAWNFGDGSTSTERGPTHVYTHDGNYTVTLSAANTAGTSTKASTTSIKVTLPPAPRAKTSASP